MKSKAKNTNDPLAAYDRAQAPAERAMCETLRALIAKALPEANAKVWHGSPVWFDGENPVVGYSVSAKGVNLLFWNGLAFDETALTPVGKYGAAQAIFREAGEIQAAAVRRWLKKAKANVFDSVGFFRKQRAERGKKSR